MRVPNTSAWTGLDDDSRKRLLDDAAREIARRSFVGAMVYFVTVAVLPLASPVWSEHRVLTATALVLTFLGGLARAGTARRLIRRTSIEPVWLSAYQAAVVVTTASWGIFCAAILYLYGNTWASTYLLIAGASLAGGLTNSLAPHFRLAAWALLGTVLPTGVAALMMGNTGSAILGISASGYLVFLVTQARYNWKAYWKAATAPALDAMLSRHAATRSEARFQTLFEDAPSGIYVALPDGQVEIANAGLAQMLGYKDPTAIMGRMLREFSPDWAAGQIHGLLDERGYVEGWESDWFRGDGTQIRVRQNIRAVKTGSDNQDRLLGMVEDVTSRFAADQTRRQLIEILEGTSDFVESISATGETLYLNRASRKLLGEPASEPASLWSRTGDEELKNARLRFAGEHGIWQGESWLAGGDGRPVPVSQVIISHRRSDGAVDSYSIISRDISAMREAQGKLQESGERLFQAQRLESLGRLAGGIAHDFNNLLTVIIGQASLIEPEMEIDKIDSGIREIAKAAEQAAQLTRQLLAFGRKQMLAKGVVDVRQIVIGAERMLRRLIGERIELVTELTDERQTVISDGAQLEQVLVNLVLNARDAMPHGGRVTIETSIMRAGRDTDKTGQLKESVRVRVSDTGIGMDEVTMARIFEPFFTTKGYGHGAGLGLATAYGFITQSGGDITVSSTSGEGTSFVILLPRCSADEGELKRPAAAFDPRGTERVLVVDDEPGVRSLMRQILAGRGYRVVEAADGEEALERARNAGEPFDLLVTDMVMPGLTGTQLAGRLKAEFPAMAVLFVSGYPGETDAERAAFGPGAAYLAKPFSPEMLLWHARRQIEGGRAAAAKV
ncbi:MAG TPA: ATP-binding protein [Bryobacteraceae bacterium]|jgi:PAS domain S-box-containing protein|nr:ATP-binding protein [Bryobacteraceae bacterium]